MELKIVLPSLTHDSDGHFVEINLKAIFKGFYSYSEEICCLFPETKKIFVDFCFAIYFSQLALFDNPESNNKTK